MFEVNPTAPVYKLGQPVVWAKAPKCGCYHPCRGLATFERVVGSLMPGYVEVHTCRGLSRVLLTELRPAGPDDLSPVVDGGRPLNELDYATRMDGAR
ncbi:hypothetical protein [Nocardia cyriacigeorgica]|uniref:hypothetical protein n=1 Tax=Nocardia cyriacigeorgica TaxID=135487 RepID=UPI00245497F5|nr:hypothetical protein [Nocardia cyriacigeorgica]